VPRTKEKAMKNPFTKDPMKEVVDKMTGHMVLNPAVGTILTDMGVRIAQDKTAPAINAKFAVARAVESLANAVDTYLEPERRAVNFVNSIDNVNIHLISKNDAQAGFYKYKELMRARINSGIMNDIRLKDEFAVALSLQGFDATDPKALIEAIRGDIEDALKKDSVDRMHIVGALTRKYSDPGHPIHQLVESIPTPEQDQAFTA
jgi:hypothetical protein